MCGIFGFDDEYGYEEYDHKPTYKLNLGDVVD